MEHYEALAARSWVLGWQIATMLFCRILGFLKFHAEVATVAPDRQERYLTRCSPNPLSLISARSPDPQRTIFWSIADPQDRWSNHADFIDIS